MVFMSTCDAVDFHALLFKEAQWPTDLDAAVDTAGADGDGKGNGAGSVTAAGGSLGPAGKTAYGIRRSINGGGNKESSSSSTNNISGGSSSSSSSSSSNNANQFMEPLEASFTGIFGPDCRMFRLHGNVPQNIRQQVYREFCAAKSGILFCTDVAARGLDLPEVDWILQYDPPCETTDVSHR
jgi:ATP-dependent RNA helicase DDX31/DBP7